MAKVLVKKTSQQTADLAQLYNLLAGQISSPLEKEKFLKAKP